MISLETFDEAMQILKDKLTDPDLVKLNVYRFIVIKTKR